MISKSHLVRVVEAFGLMVYDGVVLGWIVAFVAGSWGPVDTELPLGFAATHPMEAHIHCLGSLGDNGFVDDAYRRRVVSLNRCFWLRPTHFNKCLS